MYFIAGLLFFSYKEVVRPRIASLFLFRLRSLSMPRDIPDSDLDDAQPESPMSEPHSSNDEGDSDLSWQSSDVSLLTRAHLDVVVHSTHHINTNSRIPMTKQNLRPGGGTSSPESYGHSSSPCWIVAPCLPPALYAK